MKLRCILFDMDGTLLDTKHAALEAAQKGLASFHLRKQLSHEDFLCLWGHDAFGFIEGFVAENCTHMIDKKHIMDVFLREYSPALWREKIAPFPGIPEILSELKQRELILGVLSNSTHSIVMQMMDLYFPGIFSFAAGTSKGLKKPDPRMVQPLLRQFFLKPEEVLLVGDTDVDLHTAVATKMEFAAATWDHTVCVTRLLKKIQETNHPFLEHPKQLLPLVEAYNECAR